MFGKKKPAPEQPVQKPLPERQQRIYDFLRLKPIGVMSTSLPNGNPHGSVIYYCIDQQFTIKFLTKSKTRKYENLKQHDQVVITVFEPETQTTAEISGKAVEVTESVEINSIAGSILAASMKTSGAGLPPISKLDAGEYVAFKIVPEQIKMAVYARPDPGDYTSLFETIEAFELKDY